MVSLSLTLSGDRGRSESPPAYTFVRSNAPIRAECPANPVRSIAASRSSKQSRPWTTKNDRGRTDFGTRPWMRSSQLPISQCLHAFIFVQGRSGRCRLMAYALCSRIRPTDQSGSNGSKRSAAGLSRRGLLVHARDKSSATVKSGQARAYRFESMAAKLSLRCRFL
jgi:hypothetical protein